MDKPMEMRKELRYRLDAPALFSWESGRQKRLHGEGVTRDISVFGAFILTAACPPMDVPIQMEVVLPSLTGLKPVIRLRGLARVLRVEHKLGGKMESGFAIVSEDFAHWSVGKIKDESALVSRGSVAAMGNQVQFQMQNAHGTDWPGLSLC
jgi:hypothetical protein